MKFCLNVLYVLFSWKLNVNFNVYFVFSLVTNLLSFDSMLPFKFPLKVCALPIYLLLKSPSDFVLTIEL